jgi:nitric oxide dioxygenase
VTPSQIALVQQSFELVLPVRQDAGIKFYNRLFAVKPEVRTLFSNDVATQADHLMMALQMVVRSLHDLTPLLGRISELGRRHAGYGVAEEHFDLVGSVFLWTLEDMLGEAFTANIKAAWAAAYGVLASAMIAAMREARGGMPGQAAAA